MLDRDFEAFFRHARSLGFFPDVCIDVGAGYGTGSIYSGFPKAKHIAFEPLEELLPRLKERLKSYAHEIHNCALMSSESELEIKKSGVDMLGSSLMGSSAGSNENTSIMVPVKTLDSFEESLEGAESVLLKTDCQGADLEVLKGSKSVLKRCDVVIVESSLYRFWGNHQADLFDIISFMNEQGFVVYDFLDGTYRPYDNALGQLDVAFVKRHGFFRSSIKWGDNKKNETRPSDMPTDTEALEKAFAAKCAEISHLQNIIEIKDKKIEDLKAISNK